MFMIRAFFIKKKKMFYGTRPAPIPNLSFHTFGSQDASDLLQEGLVHERWGRTAHSQDGVLAVYVEHYDIVARPRWGRGASEFLSVLDKAMPSTFPHLLSPVACAGHKWLRQKDTEDVLCLSRALTPPSGVVTVGVLL